MRPTNLSHPRAITPISDPIHGRIEINVFDREFIDSPYFQRLHFILQNSVTYTTYPSNKNTRFPHSIGVCHVASQMFSRGLQNAKYGDLISFFEIAAQFIEDVIYSIEGEVEFSPEKYIKAHFSTISGLSRFLHTPLFPNQNDERIDSSKRMFGAVRGGQPSFTPAFVADTYWQAIRLYGLAHDIGHLPMSHAFEQSMKVLRGSRNAGQANRKNILFDVFDERLIQKKEGNDTPKLIFSELYDRRIEEFSGFNKEMTQKRYAELFSGLLKCKPENIRDSIFKKEFHEVRGLSILNRGIIGDYKSSFDSFSPDYARLIQRIAVSIILSSSIDQSDDKRYNFLRAIRSLVDGELDADRMDYTIRDGHACGSDIGRFDIERVKANTILIRESEAGEYSFANYIRGISGIEQFFEQRYQSYKYLIYHRTSSRTNSCLEYLISHLFMYSFHYPDSEIAELLEQFGYLERHPKTKRIANILSNEQSSIIGLDDSNLRTLFYSILRVVERYTKEKSSEGEGKEKIIQKYTREEDEFEELTLWRRSAILEIRNLLRIVLFREYNHILNPFKDKSFRDYMSKLIGCKISVEEEVKFFKFIQARLDSIIYLIRKIMSRFTFKEKLDPISIRIDYCFPKIFREVEHGRSNVRVVRENGEVYNVSECSHMLNNMISRESDVQTRLYIIGSDIKGRPELKAEVERRMNRYLTIAWRVFAADSRRATVSSDR